MRYKLEDGERVFIYKNYEIKHSQDFSITAGNKRYFNSNIHTIPNLKICRYILTMYKIHSRYNYLYKINTI